MRRIVDSVGGGDSFAPVNADPLRAMVWLTLAIQAVGIPCEAIARGSATSPKATT